MSTTKTYDRILEQLAAGELPELERKVLDLLKIHPQGLNRYEFLTEIYGPGSAYLARARGLANSTDDRKVREAIASLRERGICIVSSSGEAGYRLDTSEESIRSMINEWQSRIDCLKEHIRKVVVVYDIPHEYNPVQGRLL